MLKFLATPSMSFMSNLVVVMPHIWNRLAVVGEPHTVKLAPIVSASLMLILT